MDRIEQAASYVHSMGSAAFLFVGRWSYRQFHSFEKLQAKAPPFWWAVPLVGMVGAMVAFFAIRANQAIARRKATLDLIERAESSQYYLDIRKAFRELEQNSTDEIFLGQLISPQNDVHKLLRASVFAYINHYELVAVGCRKGILDISFYSMWMRTQLVHDWTSAKPLILLLRSYQARPQPTAFIEFESLARKLESEREREARIRRFRGLWRAFRRWSSPAKSVADE